MTQQASSQTAQERETRPAVSRLPESHVQRVFTRLTASYGRKFTSLFRDQAALEAAAQEWAVALGVLSSKQIKHGLDTCRLLSDWNPSIPEFIRLACDLPTINQVITRVLDDDCGDPVSYRVRSKLGSYRMRNNTTSDLIVFIRGYYSDCYKQALDEVAGNDRKLEPQPALPNEVEVEQPRISSDQILSNIRELRKSLAEKEIAQ